MDIEELNECKMVLETNDLTKVYKTQIAVNHVNMHIEKGDVYGFVGENGAGKTTVIRLITGLAAPTEGGYSILGIDSKDPNIYQARRKMGGIVEAVNVNKSYTALENLKIQCTIAGIQKTKEELIAIIESVGLNYKEIENKKARNFSLGMRQRLGIAMLLVSDPLFVLLDEPLNGLDPQGIVDVRQTILDLHERGITVLVSSHILAELDKVCNKIGIISKGVLVEEITMEELHAKSQKRIVLTTSDNETAVALLKNNLNISKVEIDGNEVVIREEIDMNKIVEILVANKILINNISSKEDSIEDYYFSKVYGGNKNA